MTSSSWKRIQSAPKDKPILVVQGNPMEHNFNEITAVRWAGDQYGWRCEGCEDRLYWKPTAWQELPEGVRL